MEVPRPTPSKSETGIVEAKLAPEFLHDTFSIQRQPFNFRTTFRVFDGDSNLCMKVVKEPALPYKEFHLYAAKENVVSGDSAKKHDEEVGEELLTFSTRGGPPETFDIVDPANSENIGSIRHDVRTSLLHARTTWDILSPEGKVLATLRRRKFKQAKEDFKEHQFKSAKEMRGNIGTRFEIVSPDDTLIALIPTFNKLFRTDLKIEIKDKDTSIDRRLLVAAGIAMAEREYKKRRHLEEGIVYDAIKLV